MTELRVHHQSSRTSVLYRSCQQTGLGEGHNTHEVASIWRSRLPRRRPRHLSSVLPPPCPDVFPVPTTSPERRRLPPSAVSSPVPLCESSTAAAERRREAHGGREQPGPPADLQERPQADSSLRHAVGIADLVFPRRVGVSRVGRGRGGFRAHRNRLAHTRPRRR